MIENAVLEFLDSRLNVATAMEVPSKPPGTFLVVEKTGSGCSNYIRKANIAVQSYGSSLLQAAQLNEKVVQTMAALPELDGIGACKLLRDYNFTDTAAKRYRYQAVFEVTYY